MKLEGTPDLERGSSTRDISRYIRDGKTILISYGEHRGFSRAQTRLRKQQRWCFAARSIYWQNRIRPRQLTLAPVVVVAGLIPGTTIADPPLGGRHSRAFPFLSCSPSREFVSKAKSMASLGGDRNVESKRSLLAASAASDGSGESTGHCDGRPDGAAKPCFQAVSWSELVFISQPGARPEPPAGTGPALPRSPG